MRHLALILFLFGLFGNRAIANIDSIESHLVQFNSNLEKDRFQKFQKLKDNEFEEFLMDVQGLNSAQRIEVNAQLDDLIAYLKGKRKAKHYGHKEIVKIQSHLQNVYSHNQELNASIFDFFKKQTVGLPSFMFVMAKVYSALGYSWRFERKNELWFAHIGNGNVEFTKLEFGISEKRPEDLSFLVESRAREFAEAALGSSVSAQELNAYAKSLFIFDQEFTWRSIVSLQCLYNGLSYMQQFDYKMAISELVKANILGSHSYANWALYHSLAKEIDDDFKACFQSPEQSGYVMAYFYNHYHHPHESIVQNFQAFCYEELINENRAEQVKLTAKFYNAHLNSSTIKSELEGIYHFEMAQYFILKQSRSAFSHVRKTSQLMPKHVRLPYFSYCCVYISMQAMPKPFCQYGYDTLLKVTEIFPFAKQDPGYPEMEFRTLIGTVFYYIDRKDAKNSFEYYQKLVEFLNQETYKPDPLVMQDFFENLGTLYSWNKDYHKSRAVLLHAIKFAKANGLDYKMLQAKYDIIKNR